jgi:hypothetical protein
VEESRFEVRGVNPEAPTEPAPTSFRRPLFVGAFLSLFVLLIEGTIKTLLMGLFSVPSLDMAISMVVIAVALGFTVAPLGLVEAAFSRLPASIVRDGLGGVLAGLAALGLLIVGAGELVFAFHLLRTDSVSQATELARAWVTGSAPRRPWLLFFACLATPFVPATAGRLRRMGLAPLTIGTIFTTTILAWPLIALESTEIDPLLVFALAAFELVFALALPLMLAAADAIEGIAHARLTSQK